MEWYNQMKIQFKELVKSGIVCFTEFLNSISCILETVSQMGYVSRMLLLRKEKIKKLNNMNPLLKVQNSSDDRKWVKIISCTNAKFTKNSNMLKLVLHFLWAYLGVKLRP